MTTAISGPAPTALSLLFGTGGEDPAALASRLLAVAGHGDLGPALEHLPQSMREAATHELAAAAAGLLDLNLADVIIAGWREHADIVAAARRSLASHGSAELVGLVAHRITMTQQPYVSLLADGHRIATLQLGLSLVLDITAVVGVVRAGRLSALQAGHCDVTATLAMQGIDVATQRARLELPGVIGLGAGIPLIRPHPDSSGPGEEEPAGSEPAGHEPAAHDHSGSQSAAV